MLLFENENRFLISALNILLIFLLSQFRCMGHAKLFPPDNPVWCKEKNDEPVFRLHCCQTYNMCNKDIILKLPERGENNKKTAKNKTKYYHLINLMFILVFITILCLYKKSQSD